MKFKGGNGLGQISFGLLKLFSCPRSDTAHAAVALTITENHNLRPQVTSEVGSDLIRSPIFGYALQLLFYEIFSEGGLPQKIS